MVLPFENTSNRAEYNWVGESFRRRPGRIAEQARSGRRLERRARTGLPSTPLARNRDSLARHRHQTRAPGKSDDDRRRQLLRNAARNGEANDKVPRDGYVQVTSRVIKVNEGRTLGEVMDGGWATRQFDYGGPLTTLQDIHGRLAYQILYQRDKALPYSQNQIVQEATKIPQKAFEAYVKAVQLPLREELRANYLKNALRFYAESLGGAVYPQAAFELGRGYMSLGNWKEATEYFSKIQKKEPHYAEAAFYASLGYTKLGDYGRALATVVPLSSDLPLIAVYNNAGAVAVQAARENKNDAERTRLLAQGADFLGQASKSAPTDPMVHFNYGYALFLAGKYAEAAEHFRPVITSDQQDGQAYFLFSKSLAKLGNTEAATAADDMARRYLRTAYAKWETEWQKSQTTSGVNLRMRDVLNREEVFGLDRETKIAGANGLAELGDAGPADQSARSLSGRTRRGGVARASSRRDDRADKRGSLSAQRSHQSSSQRSGSGDRGVEDGDLLGSETDRRAHSARQDLSRTRRPRRGAQVCAERHHHRPKQPGSNRSPTPGHNGQLRYSGTACAQRVSRHDTERRNR